MFLSSSKLPVPNAFSTRVGGLSEGAYSSLNLGYSVGDDLTRVLENRRRLARSLCLDLADVHTLTQVHGNEVIEASGRGSAPGLLAPLSGTGDAIWTDRPDATVAIKNADCPPVLIVDPDRKRVAAVHSGWRGTELRVVALAVEALERRGAEATRLQVAIGPSIRSCCYEVSEDLAVRLQADFGTGVINSRGRWRLDLVAMIVHTLRECRVASAQIDILPHCTSCDRDRFFSHRRDRGITGQHFSLVQCRF